MQASGADVDGARASEDAQRDEVRCEAGGGDGEQPQALDVGGVAEAPDRSPADERGDEQQREGVERGGEDLGAVEAEGSAHGVGSRCHADREQREGERPDVGEDVPGVGEQGERVGREPAGDLEGGRGEGDGERDAEAARVAGRGGAVVVLVGVGHAI